MALFPRLYNPVPIEPICDIGQNLLLQKPSGLELYQVQYIDPLPASPTLTVNLATNGLATLASTGATPINLQNQEFMNDGELAQFRFYVLDPALISLFQPQAQGRNLTQLTQAQFSMFSRFSDPWAALTEHFVYEQNPAFAIATNPNAVTLAQVRLQLFGFRYVLAGFSAVSASHGNASDIKPIQRFANVAAAVNYTKNGGEKWTLVPISGWAN